MLLGSLLGEYQEEWYLGGDWRTNWERGLRDIGWTEEWEPFDPWDTARYLMERYTQWAPKHLPLTMHTTEVPFDQRLAPGVQMRGYLDGLADWAGDEQHPSGLYVVEFKSSGKWDRFYTLHLEVQSWVYMDAMRRQGSDVLGTIYPYTLTTHYKTEQPIEKSFRYKVVRWDPRTAEHYRNVARDLAERAKALEAGTLTPVRHIGRNCGWCPFVRPCLRPHEVDDGTVAG